MAKTFLDSVAASFNDSSKMEVLYKTLLSRLTPVYQTAMQKPSLCQNIPTPNNLAEELLVLLNINAKEMQEQLTKVGMIKNRMYLDIYYQILMIVYYIGVINDNHRIATTIRQLAIFAISIKLWNGRKKKYFPFCKEEIMNHLYNNVLDSSSILKKHFPPIIALMKYFPQTIDQKYTPMVKTDHTKIKLFFAQIWARIDQIFRVLATKYYYAYENGHYEKDAESGITVGNKQNESVAPYESYHNLVEKEIEKMVQSIIFTTKYRVPDLVTKQIKDKLLLTTDAITKLSASISDIDNSSLLKDIYMYMMLFTKTQSLRTFCSVSAISIIDKILGSKGEQNAEGFKGGVDKIIQHSFGADLERKVSYMQYLKLRKACAYLIIFRLKEQHCKIGGLD